jgi:hypothetical protein
MYEKVLQHKEFNGRRINPFDMIYIKTIFMSWQ